MSRTTLPFHVDDMSALARSLKSQLAECPTPPGHLEILNMLARASGHRNFQHYRAEFESRAGAGRAGAEQALPVATPVAPPAAAAAPEGAHTVDPARIRRLLRFFDREGRLVRWPPKRTQQESCLWVIWSRVPPGVVMNERQLNEFLKGLHLFGDHALLRRWMCDYGMMTRTADGREYRRVEMRPPAEPLELMRRMGERPA